jgi:hypothetical protein
VGTLRRRRWTRLLRRRRLQRDGLLLRRVADAGFGAALPADIHAGGLGRVHLQADRIVVDVDPTEVGVDLVLAGRADDLS